MTIQTDLAPVQCKLVRICLEFNGNAMVRSDAEIDIFNDLGTKLMRYTVAIPWTSGEQTTIENNIVSKYAAFVSANNLIEYEE